MTLSLCQVDLRPGSTECSQFPPSGKAAANLRAGFCVNKSLHFPGANTRENGGWIPRFSKVLFLSFKETDKRVAWLCLTSPAAHSHQQSEHGDISFAFLRGLVVGRIFCVLSSCLQFLSGDVSSYISSLSHGITTEL